MSNEPSLEELAEKIRDAYEDVEAQEKYADATIESLPRLLAAKHVMGSSELQALRMSVMNDLALRFSTVFDPDAMKVFYEYHPTTAEVDEARRRVFRNLGWDEKAK